MIGAVLSHQLSRFERAWDYDAAYLRRLLRASVSGFLRFALFTGAVDRRAAPVEALAAVEIAGVLSEDCGPCTQLAADKAARAGAPLEVISAILAGDEASMGSDASLAFRFARATLARDLDAADQHRAEILQRWGEMGLVALALSLTSSRMYPTLKYALGHGRTCSRVLVGGKAVPTSPL